MKIPYSVNMSDRYEEGIVLNDIVIKKEITEDEELELLKSALIDSYRGSEYKYYHPHHKRIYEKYKENIEKVKDLELKINRLEQENKILNEKIEGLTKKVEDIEKLKQENQTLKEKLGMLDSEWQIEKDLAWRNNPLTGEFEQYGFPTFFSIDYVENLRFTDGKKYMYHFSYKEPEKKIKEYDMPVSLYDYIKKYYDMPSAEELFMSMKKDAKQQKPKEKDKSSINTIDEMKEVMESFKEYGYRYRNLELVHKFLIENKDKPFERKKFTGKCEISARTVSKYLKMLEKCEFIVKLPDRGKYKVNIK